MKKTVSWSAETMKREAASNAAAQKEEEEEAAANNKKSSMKKSSSSCVPTSNTQANTLRIQQMIAMQKAQNATMRQLMSGGAGGPTMASPSGLRDLVMTRPPAPSVPPAPANHGGGMGIGNVNHPPPPPSNLLSSPRSSNLSSGGAHKTIPLRPPGPESPQSSTSSSKPVVVAGAGIHFRKKDPTPAFHPPTHLPPQSSSSAQPYNHNQQQQRPSSSLSTAAATAASPTVLTHPHLHPQMPHFGGSRDEENDSPVSYNSVLDQNSTPSKVVERKQIQQQMQQLQVIRSVPQAMMDMHADNNNRSASKNMVVTAAAGGAASGREEPQALLPPIPSSFHNNAQDTINTNVITAAAPLATHTHHQFHYGSNLGGAAVGATQYNNYGYNNAMGQQYDQPYGGDPQQQQYHHPHPPPNSSPMDRDIHFHTSSRILEQRINRRRRSILWTILCYPLHLLTSCCSEQMGRSFCFGAIDGMLTGAGIFSACVGLDLVPQLTMASAAAGASSIHFQWIPFVLTLAATCADAVCMAIGHIWSTTLVSGAAYEERKEEARNFQISRADAKARLVDKFLMHGMLKIDAMSLADTLEGYPDLFVNALLGGDICATADENHGYGGLDGGGGSGFGMGQVPGENAPLRQTNTMQQQPMGNPWNNPEFAQHPELKYESYSDFSAYRDPDLKAYTETVSESKWEGLFMMLSFSSFSVIPSLIYIIVPPLLKFLVLTGEDSLDSLAVGFSLCITAVIMFWLGVWKSHFYSSNWCAVGMKNTGVLVLCIATAYSLGSFCRNLISSQ